MKIAYKDMHIDESVWTVFLSQLNGTLDALKSLEQEHAKVLAFIESTKTEIVEA
ncbi:MAG: hypothetical protein MK538_06525 [Planctomycetes bacterium]|nr:hypothetical protein [Planctomycetota bacterium]